MEVERTTGILKTMEGAGEARKLSGKTTPKRLIGADSVRFKMTKPSDV